MDLKSTSSELINQSTPHPFLYFLTTCSHARYIQSLHAYLSSFLSRTKPLLDLSEEDARAEAAFAPLWDESKLAGWEEESEEGPKGTAANGAAPAAEGIWCPACSSTFSSSASCSDLTLIMNGEYRPEDVL